MTKTFFIKPAADSGVPRLVPDPDKGGFLEADGALKPRSAYWLRRLMHRDVVEVEAPQAAAPAKTPSAPKK